MGRLRRRALEVDRRYRASWDALAGEPRGVRLTWVVLGDSAAVGLGAPKITQSYVALAAQRISASAGRAVHVINLAQTGATASSVVQWQLPRLRAVGRPDVVSCVVGGNDVAWPVRFRGADFARSMDAVASALPAPAVLGLVPSFGHWPYEGRVRAANESIRRSAAEHRHEVADLYAVSAGLSWPARLRLTAEDRFHPNAEGHRRWADAIVPALIRALEPR